jgi:hypothetical protein
MLINPDAVTGDGRLCEFKTTSVRDVGHGWGRAGSDLVPLAYSAQCFWGMGILGLSETLLCVLSGAPRFEFARYRIRFDQPTFDYLRASADAFRLEVANHEKESAA